MVSDLCKNEKMKAKVESRKSKHNEVTPFLHYVDYSTFGSLCQSLLTFVYQFYHKANIISFLIFLEYIPQILTAHHLITGTNRVFLSIFYNAYTAVLFSGVLYQSYIRNCSSVE